jgi:Flp pilus assembly protein TadG
VRGRPREGGQALVELALILPLLLLLLVGALDLGRLFYTYIGVVDGAREGASYAMTHPTDVTGITNAARLEMGGDTGLVVDAPVCDSACASTTSFPGNTITVRVSKAFSLIVPLLPGFTISASSTAVIQ